MKLKANNEIRLANAQKDRDGNETKPANTVKAGELFETDDVTGEGLIACGAAYEPTVTEVQAESAAQKAAEKAEQNAKK